MAGKITAANANFQLSITSLFPVPQRIQGFSTDAMWDSEAVTLATVEMGVDGQAAAGFVPALYQQTIHLQASSTSNDLFGAWVDAMNAAQEVYFANGALSVPSLGKSWVMYNGTLTSAPPLPAAAKTLRPLAYIIMWESVLRSPLAAGV